MPKISVIIPVYNLEKYIEKMLLSVKTQTFDDFEAILLNDGSTDRSLEIIQQVISDDVRFRVINQKNSGVSAARNRGLDEAKGEYVIFFDGDDYIPADALENLYDSITRYDCDMAVGIMNILNDGILSTNQASKRLAKKKHVEPTDKDFIRTWSQCNKLYRLEFLNENNIRFIKAKVAEDGHFQYQVLSKIKKICGCDHIVYHYVRRPSWNAEKSASKVINIDFLNDRLKVYEDMLSYTDAIFESKPEGSKISYRDVLLTRFISDSFCQTFYRRVWQCDKPTLARLTEALNYYREKISDNVWKSIEKKQWDIGLENRLADSEDRNFKGHILDAPIISVVFADMIPADKLKTSIRSLFGQAFPSFEVMISNELAVRLEADMKEFPNIRVHKSSDRIDLIKAAKGQYICIVDEPVIFNTNGLRKMVDIMHSNGALDFVATYMKGAKADNSIANSRKLYCLDAVYGHKLRKDNKRRNINNMDNLLVNKLFRKSSINGYPFTGNDALDMMDMYRCMYFEKTRGVNFLTFVTDDVLRTRADGRVDEHKIKAHHIYNKLIGEVVFRRIETFTEKAEKAKHLFRGR